MNLDTNRETVYTDRGGGGEEQGKGWIPTCFVYLHTECVRSRYGSVPIGFGGSAGTIMHFIAAPSFLFFFLLENAHTFGIMESNRFQSLYALYAAVEWGFWFTWNLGVSKCLVIGETFFYA